MDMLRGGFPALAILLCVASAPRAQRRPGPAARSARQAPAPSPSVTIRLRPMPLPMPRPVGPSGLVDDERRVPLPEADGRGAPIRAEPEWTPPRETSILRDPGFLAAIVREQDSEAEPDFFYWHYFGDYAYCHYFEDGVDWYGFYRGPAFYWARYHEGLWWWYDPAFQRWVFLHGGHWWWQSPSGQLYTQASGAYYPYDPARGGVTVKEPRTEPVPPAAPASSREGRVFYSQDSRRMVQVSGPRAEAFLYALAGRRQPRILRFLAQGVERAAFTRPGPGATAALRLDFLDGTYALFDRDGNPVDESP